MEVDDDLQILLAEQRRELSSALSTESDTHFAFKLQLQEAMAASLSSQPSSSISPHQNFDIDVPEEIGMAHLLAEEIAKFEREKSDSEQVVAEMKRVRDELGRRIHDRAFAREILAVPEVEWRNTGDYIHKPYEGVSGGETISGEEFRLYSKGLVSEELIRGVKKVVAGIGVAICDSSGEIEIFKLRKPLVSGEISDEVAAVQALIEGVNAAITLGLKKIKIFCDDYKLRQYVTGRWVPKLESTAILVNELTPLLRRFTRCSLSFVEQKNVQFAYGLARDAIFLQVTWPGESSCIINMIETCLICLEDRDVSHILVVAGCQHRYCSFCMKKHAEAKLLQGVLPKCPHEGCKSELNIEYCRKFLTPEVLDVMSQRIKEATVPVAHKIYCPYPRCSALMSRTEVCAINAIGGSRCTKCHGLFCINCNVPWHSNMSCSHYKKLHPYPCAEEVKLKRLATQKRWRQCEKCHDMIELKEGCYHISCRCGHEFCYICGAEWKNKRATCTCKLWDERNIEYAR